MLSKRVLVVDDSRTALLTLRKMLEKQGLEVDMAESAEAALDYLHYQRPDAIFMDHMMPGMDGFEAVKSIKDNPETATIPIMMYTTKSGEMYVSQARALGAVGVLPKEVKPAELFQVLCTLGVTNEQRSQSIDALIDRRNVATGTTTLAEVDPSPPVVYYDLEHNEQDSGQASSSNAVKAMTAQIRRLLEEQRHKIQGDLDHTSEKFSHEISKQLSEHGLLTEAEREISGEDLKDRRGRWRDLVLLAGLFVACLWLYNIYHDEKVRANELALEKDELISRLNSQQDTQGDNSESASASSTLVGNLSSNERNMLSAIEWAVNMATEADYAQPIMNDQMTVLIDNLVSRLTEMDFKGTLLLRGHVGEFCLQSSSEGLTLPNPGVPIGKCQIQFLSSSDAQSVGGEQSIGFANYISSEPAFNNGLIDLKIESAGNDEPAQPYPSPWAVQSAGEWNRIAQANNRLEIRILPSGSSQ